jgi:hypothetical protein
MGLVEDLVLDPKRRMTALVVEDLEALEHRVHELDPSAPLLAVEKLDARASSFVCLASLAKDGRCLD